jgi:K+-sensing histidine kinase KdpD
MTLHTTVRMDKQEQDVHTATSPCSAHDKTLVWTTGDDHEQVSSPMVRKITIFPLSKQKQYGIALVSTGLAFLLRLLADAYLGDSLPFVTFLIAIAATAWCGGIGASLMALISGALLWNWFFVEPHYTFTMGTHVDMAGLTVYLAIGVAIIGYIQTWRWAWKQSEETVGALRRERVRWGLSKPHIPT